MFQTLQEVEHYFDERNTIGIKPGLERVHLLLENVGHPERKLSAVHVAGTNGKGSTIQFLKNALISSQYVVGVFTSPSFTGIGGHFLINNQQIQEKELIKLMNEIYPQIILLDNQNMHPTAFEIITVMAFLYFKDRVDIALIETGMGGRYDTTNCFDPLISIITNVEKDHMLYLGNTIEEISYHKAGIVKRDCPVIVGKVSDESEQIIREEARQQQAPLYQLEKDFTFQKDDNHAITWKYNNEKQFTFTLQMRGIHQAENASLAWMALVLLNKKGCTINWASAKKSVNETWLPGRFERVSNHPTIILDSAHNVAGIKAFLHTVIEEYRYANKHLIFAGFKDKQLQEMIEELQGEFSSITVTSFDHERAAELSDLTPLLANMNVKIKPNWKRTVLEIVDSKSTQNEVYFITGSLQFITLVRKVLT